MRKAPVAPLTVLQLVANRWWTGSADPVIQLSLGLQERGHRVLLGLIPGDRFEAKARAAGLQILPNLSLDTHVGLRALVRDVLALRAVLREGRVDVIHAHHSHDHWLGLLASRLSHPGRPPLVRTFHNLRAVKRGRLASALHRRTAAVFAVSRQIEARCRAAGIPGHRVVALPGLVDLGRFSPSADGAPVREEFKIGDAPVVVTVSRFAANRGHELLLAAFARLLVSVPRARLLLVGKGETRGRLERLVAELAIVDGVIFTGYRDRDLPAVLAAADCFVLMAAGSDQSCRAALEAMAAGRPVVARAAGALPDMVADGTTGLLLHDPSPERLAEALETILMDRETARRMGRAARRRAETEHSRDRVLDIVEAAYGAVLGPPRPA